VRDFFTIFRQEVLRRVRSRGFILGTLLGLAGVALITTLPSFLEKSSDFGDARVVLIGPPSLTAPARTLLTGGYRVVAVLDSVERPPDLAFLEAHENAVAALRLAPAGGGLRVDVYSRNLGRFAGRKLPVELLPLHLSLVTHHALAGIGALTTFPIDLHGVASKFSDRKSADTASSAATLLTLLLYIAIIFNSQAVMGSVTEEKTSRIAELLVATTSPAALLAAKVAAVGLTGLAQDLVWLGAALFLGARQSGAEGTAVGVAGTAVGAAADASAAGGFQPRPEDLLAFLIFFAIGYLQYAVAFAAAGSLVNRAEDIAGAVVPLLMPVIVGYMLAQVALAAPQSWPIVAASYIPLLAPFVMFARIAVSTVAPWELALSLAVNLAAVVALVVLAGKVYRAGLLMYGRPPSLGQVWSALRA
jgi:ABC-2 type transport system permease protein